MTVETVDFSVWPKGEPNTAYAQYFTGNSYLAPMEGGVNNVTFECVKRRKGVVSLCGVFYTFARR